MGKWVVADEVKDGIGVALGRIPSGCAIATACHDGRSTGMLASWFQQASFEPPVVTLALKPERPITALIAGSGRFVLNVVSEASAGGLFKHFGAGFAPGQDAFSGVETVDTPYGPALRDAVARLGCSLLRVERIGDHDLYIGEVQSGDGDAGVKPYVHLRKAGFSY